MNERLLLVGTCAGIATLGAAGIVFLKRASELLRSPDGGALGALAQRLALSLDLWIGVSLYAAAFVWLLLALPHVRISQFYPMAVGFNILFTAAAGLVFLGEGFAVSRLLGMALIMGGVFLVSR